jgi:hypothetical protein
VRHMHTYEARNSDCLGSLTQVMRPVARIQEEEEGVQVHRQAQELEEQVDILDENLDKVRSAAKPILYAHRKATPKKPAVTFTLGNQLAAMTLRGTTEPAVDPDQQLHEELDRALAGMQEASG